MLFPYCFTSQDRIYHQTQQLGLLINTETLQKLGTMTDIKKKNLNTSAFYKFVVVVIVMAIPCWHKKA